MDNVQAIGHIGRGNQDGIRFPAVGFAVEEPVGKPVGIPFFFHILGTVLRS
jgi:hypothetical protein